MIIIVINTTNITFVLVNFALLYGFKRGNCVSLIYEHYCNFLVILLVLLSFLLLLLLFFFPQLVHCFEYETVDDILLV